MICYEATLAHEDSYIPVAPTSSLTASGSADEIQSVVCIFRLDAPLSLAKCDNASLLHLESKELAVLRRLVTWGEDRPLRSFPAR